MNKKMDIYKTCDIKKTAPPDPTVDDKKYLNHLVSQYRTLPSFENTYFEYKFTKHYSLQRNEFLKCRWERYRNNMANKIFEPFAFPEMKDLHFYNGNIRFLPSLTTSRQSDVRIKMKPGPRCDWRGQVPIPYESLMKRGVTNKENKLGKQNLKKEGKKSVIHEKNRHEKHDKIETKKNT